MSPAELRALAREIVLIRRLLILSLIAELRGDDASAAMRKAGADTVWSAWPIRWQLAAPMDRRVLQPIQRKIDREGILAQQRDENR